MDLHTSNTKGRGVFGDLFNTAEFKRTSIGHYLKKFQILIDSLLFCSALFNIIIIIIIIMIKKESNHCPIEKIMAIHPFNKFDNCRPF